MAEKLLKYEIQADVKGRESITGLADDLDDVAKMLGGEGSKQAPAAAAHLRELAQQDAAITTFKKLHAEVRASTSALKAADAKAANCAKQVAAMDPPTAKRPPPCSGAYPRWRGVANLPPRGWCWSILLFHPTPTAARERILALFEVWYRRWEFQFAPAISGGRSPQWSAARPRASCFNPRPPLLAGDTASCARLWFCLAFPCKCAYPQNPPTQTLRSIAKGSEKLNHHKAL